MLLVLAVTAAAGSALLLQSLGLTPRALAPYLEQRTSGHNPVITGTGAWLARALMALDRGPVQPFAAGQLTIGAQPAAAAGTGAGGASRLPATGRCAPRSPAPRRATRSSCCRALTASTASSPSSVPVRHRSASPCARCNPGRVQIEFAMVEGFNGHRAVLDLRKPDHPRRLRAATTIANMPSTWSARASDFIARNNVITDFNAHFKINGSNGRFPDRGLIEGNTLSNATVRDTGQPGDADRPGGGQRLDHPAQPDQRFHQGRRQPGQLWRVCQGRGLGQRLRAEHRVVRTAPARGARTTGGPVAGRRRHRCAVLPRRPLYRRAGGKRHPRRT